MAGIPRALETDPEDVTWALQTAEALWRRHERADALVWLRRAAQAAGETEHDDRALELAHDAAELAEWIAQSEPRAVVAGSATHRVDDAHTTQTDETEEVSVEITIEDSEPSLPRDRMDTPTVPDEPIASSDFATPLPSSALIPSSQARPPPLPASHVLSAAEKHAGMLDPWAEGDTRARVPETGPRLPGNPPPLGRAFEADEVVTSAPIIRRGAVGESPGQQISARPVPTAANGVVADVVGLLSSSKWPAASVDLAGVDAFSDLPDDARIAFARGAVVRELSSDEEVSGFALALVLEGEVDLAATIVDTPAMRIAVGGALRGRGPFDHVAPLRLVAASETARVATWDERSVEVAFRVCPWVEDDLRAEGDRLQAMVGLTMGPLGERLDPFLREHVASRLVVRVLAQDEVFVRRGKPVPGLLIVGAGELELVRDDGTVEETLRAGEFLFPSQVLRAGPAPSTVRATKGGAIVLFADRHAAQELLVTCPPLLELFAEM